jgi:uncharacterized protein (DUF2252 family)
MARKPSKGAAPKERADVLLRIRHSKMARNAHAYVRGSAAKFYEWLEVKGGKLPRGPSVWICGDCHLGNLGPLADAKGSVDVQIRDLDQTVIGNPAHDLVRLGLSLASAARGCDLPGVTTARMLEELTSGYEDALNGDFDSRREKSYRPKRIRAILARAVRRRWRQLAEERLENVRPSIPLGRCFWSLTKGERRDIGVLFEGDDVRNLITSLKGRSGRDEVEVLDAAYWLKGCSSLGRLRYAVLVGVGKRKAAHKDLFLIDIKESVKAAAPRAADAKMPRDNAERVVTGARALSPNLGKRMMASRLFDKSVVLRELTPQDLKIEIGRRYCWTRAWAPNGHGHTSQLGRRVDTQSNQKPGRALLALVKRRRVDLCSRGRLPRSLPPARPGLPYGPEHAYRSRRVSTIETTIDPAIPVPFEKNRNILQANSARPKSFRGLQRFEMARRACRRRFDETPEFAVGTSR